MKDELNIAPQMLQRRPLQLIDSPPGEGDGAALAVHQLQQRAPGGGLAAAGLAHQPQRLAGVKIETDVFHRVHPASDPIEQSAAQIKARNQMLHPQDRRGAWRHGILRRRIPSPPGSGNFAGSGRSAIAPASAPPPAAPGIGLLRRGEQLAHPILLHLLTAAHHQHPVGDLRHHAHVVSDEDHPICISRCSTRISCRICAWMVTSRAVVGSSAISNAGLQESAMAIITRWRMPPESWCG